MMNYFLGLTDAARAKARIKVSSCAAVVSFGAAIVHKRVLPVWVNVNFVRLSLCNKRLTETLDRVNRDPGVRCTVPAEQSTVHLGNQIDR